MTLGECIVKYRKRLGLSQKHLAETIGITPTCLNYWEKDKRQPDVQSIKALSRALNVSADYLIGREEKVVHQNSVFEEKFAALDEYGKKLVEMVLDLEYQRCTADPFADLNARLDAARDEYFASQAEALKSKAE